MSHIYRAEGEIGIIGPFECQHCQSDKIKLEKTPAQYTTAGIVMNGFHLVGRCADCGETTPAEILVGPDCHPEPVLG